MGCQLEANHKHISAEPNFGTVQWYAERASAVYQSEQAIKKAFPNTTGVYSLDHINVQYFIEQAEGEKRTVISIRGTANLANVREDAEYTQSKNDKLGIYVHRGFDEDTMTVYEHLKPKLDASHEIILTGHSLGAAISTLLMMYLEEDGFRVGASMNFGQPKVTNKKGVEKYGHLPLLRVVNEEDVVPLVPPVTLLDSIHGVYEHLGAEVILLQGEYFVYQNCHHAEKNSVGSFWKNLGHESVEEHYIANYLKNINAKLGLSTAIAYSDRKKYL